MKEEIRRVLVVRNLDTGQNAYVDVRVLPDLDGGKLFVLMRDNKVRKQYAAQFEWEDAIECKQLTNDGNKDRDRGGSPDTMVSSTSKQS